MASCGAPSRRSEHAHPREIHGWLLEDGTDLVPRLLLKQFVYLSHIQFLPDLLDLGDDGGLAVGSERSGHRQKRHGGGGPDGRAATKWSRWRVAGEQRRSQGGQHPRQGWVECS